MFIAVRGSHHSCHSCHVTALRSVTGDLVTTSNTICQSSSLDKTQTKVNSKTSAQWELPHGGGGKNCLFYTRGNEVRWWPHPWWSLLSESKVRLIRLLNSFVCFMSWARPQASKYLMRFWSRIHLLFSVPVHLTLAFLIGRPPMGFSGLENMRTDW